MDKRDDIEAVPEERTAPPADSRAEFLLAALGVAALFAGDDSLND